MSGAEAITAIQLIDACIGIVNTIIDIGRAVYDAQGLPPKLRELLQKLPAIQELLESAQERCEEESITEDTSESAKPILEQCAEALAKLRDILRKACPKGGENRTKRIWRGARTVFFGRNSEVQQLLVTIQDNLILLEQKEIYVIGGKLDALQQATEALVDNEDGKYAHTGPGNIIANEGGRPTNYVVGGSNNRQINNPGVYNEGPSTHINLLRATKDLQPSFFKTSNYESYKDINPDRVPNTCVWFLEHSIYEKWKTSSCDDLLWLSADPGCGKSVLSRTLIDERLVGEKSVTLCYFFFKDNEEQNSTATALCALLHQLLWAHDNLLQRYAAPAFEKCGEALKTDIEELWRTFISAATDPSAGDVVCILDALDECQEADRNKLINHLKNFHSRSSNTSKRGSKLKFLVTSRPYSHIELMFHPLIRSVPTIRLAGEDESDKISYEIEIVIEAKVKEIAEAFRLSDHLRSTLQRRLCEIPNRTYLWLHLTLDEIKSKLPRGKTEKRLIKIISALSSTVEEAYEKILANCSQEEARKTLQIIVAAKRPLTLSEIDVALEIEPHSTCEEDLDRLYDDRKQSILENCGLFVRIVDSRVFLLHQTAQEFLVRKNDAPSRLQGWKYSIDLQEGHRVLSEKCITYLLFRDFKDASSIPHWRSDFEQYTREHAFFEYSANHWMFHAEEAGISSTDWISRTAKLCDIGGRSPCDWLRIYSESTFRLRLYYEPKRIAPYLAVMLRLINETKFLLDGDIHWDKQGSCFADAFQAAVATENYRGKDLVTRFLQQQGDKVKITKQVVKAAVANESCGKEVIELLLQQRGDEVEITEGVVEAAARNNNCGKEVIELLLQYRGDEVKITEEVVKAAVANESCGKEVIELLLQYRGDEVKITEEVVKVATRNWNCGKEVIEFLLQQRGDEVKITEEVVRVVAGNSNCGKEVIELLLLYRGDEVKITEEVVRVAAGNWNCGKEVIELLLQQRGDEVEITEGVVKAAARNNICGKEVIELLLQQRGDEVKITEEVVKAAVANESCGKEVIELLLQYRGDEVKITEEVVKVATRNWNCGEKVIEFLLQQRGDEVKITEGVIEVAAWNGNCGKEVIELLLQQRGDKVKITEGVIEVAAWNRNCGKKVIEFLLQQRGDKVEITEGVVEAAARNNNCGKEVIELLLQYRGDKVKITEEVVELAVGNWNCGKEVIELLLQQRGDEVKITEKVVKAAVRNENCGKEVIELLLQQRGDEVKITEEVVKAAAGNDNCGKEVIALLFEQSPDIVRATLRMDADTLE